MQLLKLQWLPVALSISISTSLQVMASDSPDSVNLKKTSDMNLSSSAFPHEGKIPSKYTCDGDNINPPLTISDVPAAAKSLVIILDDPDVPKNLRADGIWDHWIVFNMPATLREIKESQEPEGTHGRGTGDNLNYFGPCPPDREHRYYFKLYALDTMLTLATKSQKSQVEQAMVGHILAKTELLGKYQKVKR